MKRLHKLLTICVAALALSACVAIQPFPYVARAGDTVTLAVGSLDHAKRNNITVTYYADSDPVTPIDLTANVRSVLNILPDKTSDAYWDVTSGPAGTQTIQYMGAVTAKHTPWQTVVVVDLPLSIPGGTGHFEVSFAAPTRYPLNAAKVDDVEIDFEILTDGGGVALTGAPSDFEYRLESFNSNTKVGDLQSLEQAQHVVVRRVPNASTPAAPAAAAEFELTVPIVDGSMNDVSNMVTNDQIAVILEDIPDYITNQVSLNWSRTGSAMKVIITSPTGNQDFNNMRFTVLISDLSLKTVNGYSMGTPAMVSSTFYDINGNDISGSVLNPIAVLR